MDARDFLVRGLIAGLVAGFVTFAVAYVVGEPQVDRAISIEHSQLAMQSVDRGNHQSDLHDPATGPTVSRHNQSTYGLATGALAMSLALGGLVALVAAGAMGRVGRLSASQSTLLVAAIGYISVGLVPFLKYPANPPGVGDPETIGHRTALFFAFVAISVVTAVAATALAVRIHESRGAGAAILAGTSAYLALMVSVGLLMPTVNEIGNFPADTLWYFRRSALMTITAMWAAIGIGLAVLVGRLHAKVASAQARRQLAATL